MMTAKFNYGGKVAFITGAGTGIGRAAALAFARAGANVAIVGLNDDSNKETLKLVEAANGRAIALLADVANETEVEAAINRTVEIFGRLDFAFNNAGVEQPGMLFGELDNDEWRRQIAVNLGGVYFCMKHQIGQMLKQGGGVIINTGSGAAAKGFPRQATYCAAKFGVVGLSKGVALDYADRNIRVNVVSPGIIATPMMDRFSGGTEEGRRKVIAQEPIGRMGRPEEIAGTVLWLCSDVAAFTTGANIIVDGGQTT
ncbi:SDR family oxidoreductase [Candidatus Kirkpatrickella diaphorinae]|uniref:SDR family oxidoreductase n=1 Tax=Candidatus Kirkpatrickella diaphorinae TaxID=2984322 RepID=A0ABY6GJ20_9PROT|nr:glucose 1-dehydrogenase [Candidatus Kirkpatrickella diaphorinae]UYH51521.1 SDR family oxidoreductase [Candidatus Kirkpatrickella diaphorinae]